MSMPYHTPFNVDTFLPFSEVSMDFCGPFPVKHRRATENRYALVVVCQQTKGVFVEDTMALSTDELMMALDILAAERGCPSSIRSDNAAAFCLARDLIFVNRQSLITEESRQALRAADLETFVTKMGVKKWSLSAPKAAHTNGLAERFVGIFKTSLLVASKGQTFTPMSFRMYLKKAQSAINSRPLVNLDVGTDLSKIVLTPNHFQRANIHADLDPKLVCAATEKLIAHYLEVDDAIDKFWEVYKSTTLYASHKLTKWSKPQKNITMGELVLVFDPTVKSKDWQMGEIVKIYQEEDGFVRRVEVKMFKTSQLDKLGRLKNIKFKTADRHISHLVPLRLFTGQENSSFSREIIERLREKTK